VAPRFSAGAACHTMIATAGDELLARARRARAVRPDVTITDLLTLVGAIAAATEPDPGRAADIDRLIVLALEGSQPQPATRHRDARQAPSTQSSSA
jgi:hypothetical protein